MDNTIYYVFIFLAFLFYCIYNVRSNLYILEYDKPNSAFIEISGKVVYIFKKKVVRKGKSTLYYCSLFECEINGETVNIDSTATNRKYEIGSEVPLLYRKKTNEVWIKTELPVLKENAIKQIRKTILLDLAGLLFIYILVSL